MTSNMSVLGAYNFDNTLFNNLVIPSDFTPTEKENLINNLVCELAELVIPFSNFYENHDWSVVT